MKNNIDEVNKTIKEANYKHLTIIEYIINKNSHSIKDGGMDYEGLLEDIEDYEGYLIEHL